MEVQSGSWLERESAATRSALGSHSGGIPNPGQEGRVASDETAGACKRVGQRCSPVQAGGHVHDAPVLESPVLISKRGDGRRQRHTALGGNGQDVQERILLRR